MFKTIRYWLRAKKQEVLAWMRRPRNVKAAIKQVVTGMKELGIEIIDATNYPMSKNGKAIGDVVVIVGYIPGKAAIFTVKFNYRRFDDYEFKINGQVKEGEGAKVCGRGLNFPKVDRRPNGESISGGILTFEISDYLGFREDGPQSSKDKVAHGMAFFKTFLGEYGNLMRKKFDNHLFMWFVPEDSDAFNVAKANGGEAQPGKYASFNARVLAKFPPGFLSDAQRPW